MFRSIGMLFCWRFLNLGSLITVRICVLTGIPNSTKMMCLSQCIIGKYMRLICLITGYVNLSPLVKMNWPNFSTLRWILLTFPHSSTLLLVQNRWLSFCFTKKPSEGIDPAFPSHSSYIGGRAALLCAEANTSPLGQDWLYNLWGPVPNENEQPLVKKL